LKSLQIDPNKLLYDLNELLLRDPNLTSLQEPANDEMLHRNNIHNSVISLGMAIPKRNEMSAVVSGLIMGDTCFSQKHFSKRSFPQNWESG